MINQLLSMPAIKQFLGLAVLLPLINFGSGCSDQTNAPSGSEPEGDQAVISSYSSSGDQLEILNRYFEYVPIRDKDQVRRILLDVTRQAKYIEDELTDGYYTIEAFDLQNRDAALWKAGFRANELLFEFGYIKAIIPGIEDAEDTYHLYDIRTGSKIMTYTNAEMRVGIPNSQDKRLIGFTSQNAAESLPDEDNLVGILTYASNQSMIDQVKIKAASKDTFDLIEPFTPDMEFGDYDPNNKVTNAGKGLILWNADENYTADDVSNIVVILTFFFGEEYTPAKVYIPIEKDGFNLKGIVHKEGLVTIER